jgi:transposase-like protein
MAPPHSVDPAARLEQHWASARPDLLREMVASFANDDVGASRSGVWRWLRRAQCRAGPVDRRNGYRSREWDIHAGTVELAVLKLREGSFIRIGCCPPPTR